MPGASVQAVGLEALGTDQGRKGTTMGLQAIFFYLFAFIAVASAFMVISAKNPVHSVLFLILVFFNSAGLFLLYFDVPNASAASYRCTVSDAAGNRVVN